MEFSRSQPKARRIRVKKRQFKDGGDRKVLTCCQCGGRGHFARNCPNSRDNRKKKIYMVQQQESDDQESDGSPCSSDAESFYVKAVSSRLENSSTRLRKMSTSNVKKRLKEASSSKWQDFVRIGGERVVVAIDTGAQCSLLSKCLMTEQLKTKKRLVFAAQEENSSLTSTTSI